jgi:uncharacterized membrane protein YhaH (DUF805 family)
MDQFIGAYKSAVAENYANFNGRLSVGGYWRFVAVNIAISVVLYILALAVDVFLIVYFLYALAVLVPGIAAAVRRLHDTGKPGTYVLVGLIPCVGLILLIVWTVAAGTPGDNQYGPQPVT